jgi:hypothetical protein
VAPDAASLSAFLPVGSGNASGEAGAEADDELEVKEITLSDGSENQRSVRLTHKNAAVTKRLLDWLEPNEAKAVKANAQIACQADTATKKLISVRCVTIVNNSPNPVYTALTFSILPTGATKDLTLQEVLKPDAGEAQVVEACKKAADPPLACVWPPTAFSIVHGDSLFICHDSSCVDIDDEASLVREGLAGTIRH